MTPDGRNHAELRIQHGRRARRRGAALTVAVAAMVLTSCSSTPPPAPAASSPSATASVSPSTSATPSPSPVVPVEEPATAGSASKALKAQIPTVTKLVTITEANDPNNKIGRPNGYTAAVVLYDSRTKCSDGLGADCGATIEQWPSPADAQARMDYIQGILKASPALGSEYDYVRGSLLLRVDGALKPSAAAAYKTGFEK